MHFFNTPERWAELAERHGIALMFALMFAFFIIGLLVWFSRKVATPMIDSHKAFLERTASTNEENSASLRELTKANVLQAQILERHDERLGRIEGRLDLICPFANGQAIVVHSTMGAKHEKSAARDS